MVSCLVQFYIGAKFDILSIRIEQTLFSVQSREK